jgi:hypothetical protein
LVDDDAGVIHRLDGYTGSLPGDLFEAIVGPETCANERLQQGPPILYNAELANEPQSSSERTASPPSLLNRILTGTNIVRKC